MMGGIIPDKHRRKVFEMLIQSGLDSIVKEGEVNNNYIDFSWRIIA